MSDFLGIDLVAGLNEGLSQSRINSTIDRMSGKLKDVKINVNVDSKVLQTIREFNNEMKKLSQAANKTGQNIDQAMKPKGGGDARRVELNNLVREYQKLDDAARKQSQNATSANRKEAQSVKELLNQYTVLNKTAEKRDKTGKTTQYRYDVGDEDGNIKATITADENYELLGHNIVTNHEKINKDLQRVVQERQSIYDKLAKIRTSGYGDEKQLQLFSERASSGDINALKSLGKEVDNYRGSLSSLSRESKLDSTLKSLETLHKTGTIRLPKNNMLSDIRERLNSATTTKEIDEVQNRIRRLQSTLSDRDKGFLKIDQIKADNIIPNKTVNEIRARLRKAETPEQTKRVLGEIDGLGRENAQLRERQQLLQQINNVEQKRGVDEKRSADLRRQIAKSDVNDYKRLNAEINKYNSFLQNRNMLEKAQSRLNYGVDRLRSQLAGGISGEDEKKILNIQRGMANLDPNTKNLSHEIQKFEGAWGKVNREIMEADKGMARFSRQLASAMVRVPIYAATMAAMFAPMRLMQDAISQSIAIDSQMTVLERVSNGTIKMNQALESSVDIAGRLGNVIEEVNDGLIAFARQGFRGDELTAMTETATLMSNVSDLSVDDAASSLTAAMKGFNIEAENSIHVVNAMNEVDNNYAITTQQLAESVQKSAGAAQTYGSSLERTIGYTSAIGEVTRESGSVIGENFKNAS